MKEKVIAAVGMAAEIAGIPAWYLVGPWAQLVLTIVGMMLIFGATWSKLVKENKAKEKETNKLIK